MKFRPVPLRRALAIAALAALAAPGFAQEPATSYPSKPIRILVPFPPGGSADIFARMLGQKLGDAWGQPVVVENKPGAGGQIATQATTKSSADGYNLLVVTVGHAVNPSLYSKLPYDTEKDLQPVASVARLPSVLVVNPALPVKSVQELVAYARAHPGKLTYASSGNATTSHVAGAMFTNMTKVNIVHVPYRGAAPAIIDIIGGQVDMMIDPVASSAQQVKAGKLRALAVSTSKRSPLVPDLPTMSEAGVPGYDFSAWFLLLAPKGVPEPIIEKINQQVVRAMTSPDLREKYASLGAEPGSGTPAELSAFVHTEIKRMTQVAREAGMKAE